MNEIQEFAKAHQCTQAEMAERLGYSSQYISNLAVGRMPITSAFVGRVIRAYGLDAAQFFLPALDRNLTETGGGE